jgi:hypothetical protein
MEGWIKLHRRIIGHWVWKSDKYFKAWAYCLFRANHEDTKVLVGSSLVPVARGQFITSRGNFGKDTGMSEQSVRTFWKLLKNDSMINQQSTSHLTMITILNYDRYQVEQPATEHKSTSQQPAANQPVTTDKNVKNVKKKKNNIGVDDFIKIIREKLTEKNSPLVKDRDTMAGIRDFVEYRLSAWAHRPFTEKAAELFATSLIRHSRNKPAAAIRIIEKSIEMGWQGIFALPEPEWQAIFQTKRQDSGITPPNKRALKQPPIEPLGPGDPEKGREVIDRIRKRLTNYDDNE